MTARLGESHPADDTDLITRTHSRAAIALPQRALRSVPEYLRRG